MVKYKYNRSTRFLIANIDELLQNSAFTDDTKAILLLLSGTMLTNKFYQLIDNLPQLNPINSLLKQIHHLRKRQGHYARDYIMVRAFQAARQEIDSSELERFIKNRKVKVVAEISHIIDHDQLIAIQTQKLSVDPVVLANAKNMTVKFLSMYLQDESQPTIELITKAYVYSRTISDPVTAFYAVVYAIEQILLAHGYQDQWELSFQLTSRALSKFIPQTMMPNNLFFKYKSAANS